MKKGTQQHSGLQLTADYTAALIAARKIIKARTEAIRRRDIVIRGLREQVAHQIKISEQATNDGLDWRNRLEAAVHHRNALQKRIEELTHEAESDEREWQFWRDGVGAVRAAWAADVAKMKHHAGILGAIAVGIAIGVAMWVGL